MNRYLLPLILMILILGLLSLQCTYPVSWNFWGVHPEFLPAILLYAAFSVNPHTALILGSLAAVMYDSYSGGRLGASLVPYTLSTAFFCALRPIFFRNRISTQFLCGIVFGFITLFLQWALSGKFFVGVHPIISRIVILSALTGVFSMIFFWVLDWISRLMGLTPGRFEDYDL